MLTETRVERGLLQSDVAEKLGKSQSFVSKYERGERRLDFPEFIEITDVLGIEIVEFIKKYKSAIKKDR